jgi:hypothetical protein
LESNSFTVVGRRTGEVRVGEVVNVMVTDDTDGPVEEAGAGVATDDLYGVYGEAEDVAVLYRTGVRAGEECDSSAVVAVPFAP